MIKIIKQQKDDILNSRRPAPLDALAQAQVQAQAQNGGGGVRSPELFNSLFEYNNLINNISYNLYDEFKYGGGEANGLINKVIYKKVKKLIPESKRVIRGPGVEINKFLYYFIKDYSNDPN